MTDHHYVVSDNDTEFGLGGARCWCEVGRDHWPDGEALEA